MIHIACCFDRNFENSFAVLANSIERRSHSDVTIHAFHDGPLEHAKSAVGKTERFNVVFYDVSGAFSKYRTVEPFTNIIFARLHLRELLKDISKVIYLDTDIIVRRDLADLFNVDLHRKPIAVVADYYVALMAERQEMIVASDIRCRADEYICKYLGMKNIKNYFNTGLLVIDLAQFAACGALERAERFLMQKKYRCVFPDQDALNVALDGNVEYLDLRWNCIPALISQAKHGPISKEIESVLKFYDEPWLIHFAGRKPWNTTGRPGPWDSYFWEEVCEMLPLGARHLLLPRLNLMLQQMQQAEDYKVLLQSRSRLAKAWWRIVCWKLGVSRSTD